MKKTKILLPLAVLGLLFGLVACGNSGEPSQGGGDQSNQQENNSGKQEKITIKADKTKLILGENVQLTASVEGVSWASSDSAIATVNAEGLVESKAVGQVTITASKQGYKDGTVKINIDLEKIDITTADGATSVIIGQT